MADHLAKTLSALGCRLRIKCTCNHCQRAEKERARASQGAAIDLADLLDEELGCNNRPPQKVSVVSELPMPAGGFCRRSSAVQWALAQEMSRQAAAEDDGFDCANEDWPALFAVDDLDDLDCDFELVYAVDDDEFVLEMLEDDEGDLDGEWAQVLDRRSQDPVEPSEAGTAPFLDFKTAIRRRRMPAVPKMPVVSVEPERDAQVKTDDQSAAKEEEPASEWPLLAGAPVTPTSCSPTSVSDVAGQWVSVVEKSKAVRVPADDKKSRNFREVCKRTVAQIRRAEKKAASRKATTSGPTEDFPPLPV